MPRWTRGVQLQSSVHKLTIPFNKLNVSINWPFRNCITRPHECIRRLGLVGEANPNCRLWHSTSVSALLTKQSVSALLTHAINIRNLWQRNKILHINALRNSGKLDIRSFAEWFNDISSFQDSGSWMVKLSFTGVLGCLRCFKLVIRKKYLLLQSACAVVGILPIQSKNIMQP